MFENCIKLSLILLFVTYGKGKAQSKSPVNTVSVNDEGLAWLETVFSCDESPGFCYPKNEQDILSPQFWTFLLSSNEVIANPYGWSAEELKRKREAHKKQWESVYPFYQEEIWPFGRGNGGIESLDNVEIKALSKQKYAVKITYYPNYTTQNEVTLTKIDGDYRIDYIKTDSFDQENKNNSDQTYVFTQKWTWKYKNDRIEDLEFGHIGEISAYYNPTSKNWLFNHDTYNISGEMFSWIIAFPNQTYCYSTISVHDEEGPEIKTKEADWPTISKMPDYFQKTETTKTFNLASTALSPITGEAYKFTGAMLAEHSISYLKSISNMNFAPLYTLGSNFSGEPRLPYAFMENLPNNYLILEEETLFSGNEGKAFIKLKSVTDTLIKINIP